MAQNFDPTLAQTFEVRSKDGTRIVSARSGSGPAIILVTGGLMDGSDWNRLEPFLRTSRTVYALNRRGRGGSGDQPNYTPEREVEDLFAVLEGIGGEVDMLAHSSGTLLALMALERGLRLRRVVFYEPPLEVFRTEEGNDRRDRLNHLLDAGDREEALRVFLRDGMNLSAEQVAEAEGSRRWAHQLELIVSVPHDQMLTSTFVFDPARIASMNLPALVLAGTASAAWFQRGARALADALPNARLERLEGQGHIAMYTAPEMLARVTTAFLSEAER